MRVKIYLDVPNWMKTSQDCTATTYPPSQNPSSGARYVIYVDVEPDDYPELKASVIVNPPEAKERGDDE